MLQWLSFCLLWLVIHLFHCSSNDYASAYDSSETIFSRKYCDHDDNYFIIPIETKERFFNGSIILIFLDFNEKKQ